MRIEQRDGKHDSGNRAVKAVTKPAEMWRGEQTLLAGAGVNSMECMKGNVHDLPRVRGKRSKKGAGKRKGGHERTLCWFVETKFSVKFRKRQKRKVHTVLFSSSSSTTTEEEEKKEKKQQE